MFVKREMGRSWGQSSLAAVGAVAGHATGPYWHARAAGSSTRQGSWVGMDEWG